MMKKLLNLENLIYLTVFLLPAYLVRVDVFGLPTNVLEILIVTAAVWCLVKPGFRNFLKPSFWAAAGLILAGLAISMLISKNYAVGTGILKGWFVLPLLFAITARNVIPAERRKNIYVALYLSATAVAVVGLFYYFSGQVTFDGRLQGIFNSPNYLAMYLASALIIGVANYALGINNKALKIASLVVILSALYLTYSYAAWAAVIISLAIMAGIRNKINLKMLIAAAVLVGLIALSQWDNPKYKDMGSERSSLQSRLMIWRAAGKIVRDNWLWGIGPGNFQNKYLEYQKYFPPYLEWAVPHPHDLYLAFWLYGGLLGLLGFFGLLGVWFREILAKEKSVWWYASLGITLYFLLHGLVDTTYFKNDLAVIFWLNFIILL